MMCFRNLNSDILLVFYNDMLLVFYDEILLVFYDDIGDLAGTEVL